MGTDNGLLLLDRSGHGKGELTLVSMLEPAIAGGNMCGFPLLSVSADFSTALLSDRGSGRAQCAGVHQRQKEQATSVLPLVAQEQDPQGR